MSSQGDCHTVLGDRDSVRPPTRAICTWTLRLSAHSANSQSYNGRRTPGRRKGPGVWVNSENGRLRRTPRPRGLHGDRVAIRGAADGRRLPPRPALVLEMVHQRRRWADGDLGTLHTGRAARGTVAIRATWMEDGWEGPECERLRTDRHLLLLGGDDPGLAGCGRRG